MATGNGNVEMMVSVLPGTMTGFAALNAGLASINNSFLLMTSAISENFGLVDTAILTTGVVVAQFAADAMSAFADFEQSMKIVQLVSGQTGDQIQYLGQKANEFAVQYRTDIDQITEGLQTLGRAGLNSATEQTEVLQNGLSTAKIEGRELNGVLQELIQNTALLGGDLKSSQFGEQSEYVNNLLMATSLSAPITTHDISETLKYSGGIAAAAGANIESENGKQILEDYMGAIAAFAQKGVSGSIAGTALRAFFNKPATQDSSVVEGLAAIHLKPEYLWEDGGDTMKPVSEQIAIIKNQMDELNISTMDQLQIWSKIVGGKMGQQMMKLDSEDIKNLTSDIRAAESANSLANESMNTFKMNINEIGQEGQKAFRDYGSTLVWIFSPVVEILKQIVHLFNNPILTTALAVGTLGFFKAFISRARQVIGGFKQGLRNIWNDYAGDNRLSISQYRGEDQKRGNKLTMVGRDTNGNPVFGAQTTSSKTTSQTSATSPTITKSAYDAQTPKEFRQLWKESNPNQAWLDFKKGKLSADQYGFISATSKWSESEMLEQMSRKGMIPQYMYDDIRKGYTKKAFMGKYADAAGGSGEYEDLVDEYNRRLKANNQQHLYENKELQKRYENISQVRQASENQKNFVSRQLSTQHKIDKELKEQEAILRKHREAATNRLSQSRQHKKDTYRRRLTQQQRANAQPQYSASENIGQSALITSRAEIDRARRGHDAEKELNDLNKRTLEERNKNKGYSGSATSKYPPQSLAQAMEQAAIEERKRLALIEEELLAERQIAETRMSEKSALQARIASLGEQAKKGSQGVANLNDETKKLAVQNKNAARNYISDSAKHNASSSFEKGAKAASNTFVQTTKAAAERQLNQGYSKKMDGSWSQYSYTEARRAFLGNTTGSSGVNPLTYSQGPGSGYYALTPDQQRGVGILPPTGFAAFQQQFGKMTQSVKDFGSTFRSNLVNYLTRDRAEQGRMIAFSNKGLGKFGNVVMNATDIMGGPFMVAMMLLTYVIQQVQQAYQEYCQDLQEAKEAVNDAYNKKQEADSALEKTYKDNGYSEEDVDAAMGDVYDKMLDDMNSGEWIKKASEAHNPKQYEYDEEKDDGSMKEKEKEDLSFEQAIDKNTAALYAATGELRIATEKLVSKMADGWWGMDGASTKISDSLGKFSDSGGGFTEGTQFSDEGSFLKTASQKDKNYAGYTELAGLMLEDIHDAEGNWEKGFRTLLGSKDGKNIANQLSPNARQAMDSYGQFIKGLSRSDNSRLQSSMMRNKKDWQGLAKEIAKYEKKNKTKVGDKKTDNKRLEKLVSKLSTETGLSRLRVLQAASLQQLQDMYEVAQGAIVPTMGMQAETAAQHYQMAANGINPATQSSAAGAQDTAANAAAIAAMLSVIAQTKAVEAAWQAGIMAGDKDAMEAKDANEYLKKASGQKLDINFGGAQAAAYGVGNAVSSALGIGKEFNIGWNAVNRFLNIEDGKITLGRYGQSQKAMDNILNTFTQMGERARHPDWSDDQIYNTAVDKLGKYKDEQGNYKYNMDAMMRMARENYQDAITPTVMDAYLASQMGENDDNGSGGDGGGSGGGDSGDKDKGTKKERVDLVLCNKKEIPKLNVNLFKKPPSFTVLNKNFKLRDIKVNTQDKPKAVLSSIKNAIIDVQKRSDPKIIQDESAEYDPVSASEGSSVPSGSTNTATD